MKQKAGRPAAPYQTCEARTSQFVVASVYERLSTVSPIFGNGGFRYAMFTFFPEPGVELSLANLKL
jgi:hypothetical protein